jgi:hypothetical protein
LTAVTPAEIIVGRPWKAALFLTYPLSLSFYESQLHKEGLRRRGCRDVRIVCDPDGYEMCLSERRSSRVGAEYRLSLASLPRGVFHPKATVLVGDEETLLLIGSGNLTFGGFGRNVEVLDVLGSKSHPAAFADFTGFLTAIEKREDLTLTDAHWTAEWVARLEPAAVGDAAAPVRVLHNVREPFGGQLATLTTQHGGAVEIRCLSPFHDSDGEGTLSLAEMCGAERLVIGRLHSSKESAFPFHQHRSTSIEIRAAKMEGDFGERPLHAKWWEIDCRDGSTLWVTGSMNATRQAIHTRNNIELVTVRHLPAGSGALSPWQSAEPVALAPRTQILAAGLGKRAFVQARLGGEGVVTGTVVMSGGQSGVWQASLEDPGGVIWQGELEVDSAGIFEVRLKDTTEFFKRLGVQIILRNGTIEARGWLEVTALLEMTRRNWLSVTTTARLLSGHGGYDETAELLNYLALHAESHLEEFSKLGHERPHRSKQGEADDKPSEEKAVPLSDLRKRDGHDGEHLREQEDREAYAILNHILAGIRKRLLASRQNGDDTQPTADDEEESGDEGRKERERGTKKVLSAREAFNQNLEGLIDRLKEEIPTYQQLKRLGADGPPAKHRALRKLGAAHALWFEGNLFAHRGLDEASETPAAFLRHWFSSVSATRLDYRTATEPTALHFVEASLMLATDIVSATGDSGSLRWKLSTLHSTLSIFYTSESAGMEQLAQRLADGSEPSFFLDHLLPAESRSTLPATLQALLAAPTLDEQIAKLTSGTRAGDLASLPVFQSRIGTELSTALQSSRRLRIVISQRSSECCAHCHMKLNTQTIKRLHADQAARCSQPTCGAFLIAPF